MIEMYNGKSFGAIELLHGNNSNRKEKMSDSYRGCVMLIDKTLMSLLCFPEKALSEYEILNCEMNVEKCCPSVKQLRD